MGVGKVEITTPNGVEALIDLTKDSVTPETLAEGATAHDASGKIITGKAKVGTSEEWIFTLEDGSTITKAVFVE